MADIGKVYNLAARFYLARKDAETGGIKNTYAPTNTTGGLKSIAKNAAINFGTNALMSKLGLAALGPLGMLLSPFVSKFIGNKFSGLGLNPGGGGGGGGNTGAGCCSPGLGGSGFVAQADAKAVGVWDMKTAYNYIKQGEWPT